MSDLWHEFSAWWLFADVPLSPAGLAGAYLMGGLVGWWLSGRRR